MADRTPDTGVLDQVEESGGGSAGGPTSESGSPESGETVETVESGETAVSGETTLSEVRAESGETAESSEPANSAESAGTPDEREAPEQTHEPDQPEDAADAAAQEPDEPKNTADAAAAEPDEPTDATGETAEEPDEPEDADEAGAGTARGEATAQEAESLAEEDPDAKDAGAADASADEDAEATSEGDGTSSDRDDDATPEEDTTSSDTDDDATPEEDTTSSDTDDGASPEDADATAPDGNADSTTEEDGTTPDERAEATPEEDGTAPDEKAGTAPEDEDGTASDDTDDTDEAASEGEPEEVVAAEASESTRTVALRTLDDADDAAGVDKTMAIDVADLPPAEPSAAPATPAAPQADGAKDAEEAEAAQPAPTPLDLLAQLTNTPPPPATPARTVLRRVKIWSPLVALLALVGIVVQLVRPLPEPVLAVDAKATSFTIGGGTFTMPWPEEGQAAVMIAGSGTIGTFGAQKPVPTASVAKIMTAYVILREHPIERDEPGPSVTVDARTVEEGKAKDESRITGLKAGQTFSLQDMLKMLMIPSGNNVARLLARWDTKTDDETAFVRKMNAAAKSLGMKNTTYTDPSGLDKGTVSTAVDQLKLAEAVMKFESFRAVVALPDAEIPGATRIFNNNSLLGVPGLSVRGIKTGSNTPAGGTLSWAAYRTVDGEDRLVLGTMMDQHVTGPDPNGSNSLQLVLDNSEKVIRAVREALTSATAVKKGQVVGHIDDGLGGRTPVVATKDVKVVGVPGQKLKLTFRDGDASLAGGAKAGTVVGELTVGSGAEARHVPLALRSDLREPSVGAKLTRIG